MTAPLAPCGTYAGYTRHYKRGEPIDQACRIARNEYVAEHRAKDPGWGQRAKRTAKIRNRALARLAAAHPKEYRRLLSAEYEKARASA